MRFVRVAAALAACSLVDADLGGIAAFAPSSHPLLAKWSGGAAALCAQRPASSRPARSGLDLQMARGGARGARGARGGARGGGRGGGGQGGRGKGDPNKAEREEDEDDDDRDARRSGPTPKEDGGSMGAGRGKKKLNQLLTRKSSSAPPAGGSVGVKMQDFDPKKMERGSVRFLGSFDSDPPKIGLPEVAFVGRSNVGKSSMLNCLTNSKIAVTSKTPGRTQRVNIFAWKESKKAGRVVAMVIDFPMYSVWCV